MHTALGLKNFKSGVIAAEGLKTTAVINIMVIAWTASL
jgi:hypothetical protein